MSQDVTLMLQDVTNVTECYGILGNVTGCHGTSGDVTGCYGNFKNTLQRCMLEFVIRTCRILETYHCTLRIVAYHFSS